MNSRVRYVALLRGINVGGNVLIKMSDLTKAFESLKFSNVTTILASGNVLFDASKTKSDVLAKTIEKKIEGLLKRPISVIVRSLDEIKAMIESKPFSKITVTPLTRLYVTFLTQTPKTRFKIPYVSPDKSLRILKLQNEALFSVLTITEGARTPDAMNVIEKEFGKKVTTRNWNTVVKMAKA